MPLYDYRCKDCGYEDEVIKVYPPENLQCPYCSQNNYVYVPRIGHVTVKFSYYRSLDKKGMLVKESGYERELSKNKVYEKERRSQELDKAAHEAYMDYSRVNAPSLG